MARFSKTLKYKIQYAQRVDLPAEPVMGWRVVLENGDVDIVRLNEVFGYNNPEAGKYLVPCGLVCEDKRRNAKCAKLAKKFGKNVPICSGQYFYIRSGK